MIRLFVGLALPDALRERLAVLACGLPNARWVEARNLHVTLRFIGEVDEATGQDVHESLSEVRAPPLDLMLNGLGTFQSGRRANALWAGVERVPELVHLRDKVESAVVRAGLAPEPRRFLPHVTLARLKDAPLHRVQSYIAANNLFRAGPERIEQFVLFSSHLGRAGADYTAEAEYPLKVDMRKHQGH